MKTLIVDMSDGLQEEELTKAGAILKAGGLVAFPTETVYGLGADALDEKASAKIYAAKGRPSDNPLIVHIAEIEALERIVKEVPENAYMLAKAFWPGPLTMIFHKSRQVPYGTTGGLDTVAVRMPDHPIAKELIKKGGGYIAAPSANTSGRPSPTQASHVIEDLSGKVDMIVDGGNVNIGLESTIVDVTGEIPVILRPGYISKAMLEEVIGRVETDKGLEPDSSERPKAPGMKYKHYAPEADLVIVSGTREHVIKKMKQMLEQAAKDGETVGIIGTDETVDSYGSGIVKSIGSIEDEETIAKRLYGILREFDHEKVSKIYSEAFETPQMGQAIMNRLMKAAGHQILEV